MSNSRPSERKNHSDSVAAKAILSRMQAIGVQMTLAKAYEALAASRGYRNWATMKAASETSPEPVTAGERFAAWAGVQANDPAGQTLKGAASGDTVAVAALCGDLGVVPLHLFDARKIAAGFHAREGRVFERRFGRAEILSVPKTVAMLQAYVAGAQAGESYEDFVQGYIEEVLEGQLPGQVEWVDAEIAELPRP